ncbi:MAG: PbsX family transcriptional regulator [Pseudomonadales bacterium]|nr:PbsX family transcriptional regulator [Pseudomonadales bacterium]MBL4867800.1 PbsX family transcriptional regulator [Pseudomonadales bacterium]
MQLEIQKWGNSAAVRLSKTLLEQLSSGIGDRFEVEVRDGGLFLTPLQDQPEFDLDELLATCTKKNTRLDDEDLEWLNDSPQGKEIW